MTGWHSQVILNVITIAYICSLNFLAVQNHMSDIDVSASNQRKGSKFEPRSLFDWIEKSVIVNNHSSFAFKI